LTLRSDIALGDVLRRARQRREESLASASRATRIAARYLEALEMDAPIGALPGPVYARTYAQHLGLDEARMIALFDERYGEAADLNADDMPRRFAVAGQEARRPSALARAWRAVTAPVAMPFRGPGSSKSPSRAVAFVPDRTHRRRDGKGSPLMFGALIAALIVTAGAVVMVRQGGATNPASAAGRDGSGVARPPALQLPRGGRTLFPTYRMVAYYGVPGTTRLGILGEGPEQAGQALLQQIHPYAEVDGKPILPAFEIIATIATGSPQDDAMYRRRIPMDQIMPFVDEARSIKAYTILDVQPGRADFLPEVEVYHDLLTQPDVGLALDPEWHVASDRVPGIGGPGSVDAASVNQVITYLTGIVRKYNLPQKLLVVHQFTENMITNRLLIKPTPQVPVVFDLDGFGLQAAKIQKYESLSGDPTFGYGFKLFYKQDVGLMTPLVVLGLAPAPDLIVYQ
jgi:hypothetical protein